MVFVAHSNKCVGNYCNRHRRRDVLRWRHTMTTFKKAEEIFKSLKLKMSIQGISGSGKTYTALTIGSLLGNKIAVIDTERGKSALYSNIFKFDVVPLGDHHPDKFVELILEAEKHYDFLIIDSLSHAWMGTNGILEQVDKLTIMLKNNSMMAWAKVSPIHKRLLDAILDANIHIIVTMRAKKEYVVSTNEHGKKTVDVVGLSAVQKESLEFEFDINAEMTLQNDLIISKTRFTEIKQLVFPKPNKEFANVIKQALSIPLSQTKTETKNIKEKNDYITETTYKQLYKQAKGIGHTDITMKNILEDLNIKSFKEIPTTQYETVKKRLTDPSVFDGLS